MAELVTDFFPSDTEMAKRKQAILNTQRKLGAVVRSHSPPIDITCPDTQRRLAAGFKKALCTALGRENA